MFERLIAKGVIEDERCLLELPHASGANAERIKYFWGEKPKELLSTKTNAQLIDKRRHRLPEKLGALNSQHAQQE